MTTDKPLSETSREDETSSRAPESVPLSVSHPALWSKMNIYQRKDVENDPYNPSWEDCIQSRTVDIAEHNRLMDKAINLFQEKQEELEKLQQLYYERNAEIERLKKELEEQRLNLVGKIGEALFLGGEEGERRAMQRAVEVIERHWKADLISRDIYNNMVMEIGRLGLSEEEKKSVQHICDYRCNEFSGHHEWPKLREEEKEVTQRALNDRKKGGVVTNKEPKAKLYNAAPKEEKK